MKVLKKVNNLTLIDAAEESFENELRKCLVHIPRPTVANPLFQIHRNLEKCLSASYKAELAIMLKEIFSNSPVDPCFGRILRKFESIMIILMF